MTSGLNPRAALLAILLASAPLPASGASAGQPRPAPETPPAAVLQDLEAGEETGAQVWFGGDRVVWVPAGIGPYSAQDRATRISQRLRDAVHDRSIRDLTVTVREVEGSSEIRVGPRLLMVVTAKDAATVGAARSLIAQQYAHDLEAALRADRLRYAPETLLRSGLYWLLATLVFVASLWAIRRVTGRLGRGLKQWLVPRSESLRALQAEIVSEGRIGRTITGIVRATRWVLILLAFDLYLTYALGLFPWTRAVSRALLGYVLTPVRAIGAAFVSYLPNLLFLIVISAIIYAAIKLVGVFFRQIGQGRLVFASFPAEWADPTNKIARVLLIAFGLIVAFPYLPASDSPAFTGVSVFIGVLVSLSSSSALSNMIAGIVLTYTGAFRLGDRVKVGDAFGDIVETKLLATRIRTIKNEDITIPNSIALGTAITNYSRVASGHLILHTSVTIGYDAPWRKVHELLLSAALATPGVLQEPRPFVWQTALNDFYVTYEINAYTATPHDMVTIYAALHARIQDEFYAAGVEIMSPHYMSVRDGNTVAIPEALRAPGYQAPAFKVASAEARVKS